MAVQVPHRDAEEEDDDMAETQIEAEAETQVTYFYPRLAVAKCAWVPTYCQIPELNLST